MKNKSDIKQRLGFLKKPLVFIFLFLTASQVLGQENPCVQFPFFGLDESQSLGVMNIEVIPLQDHDVVYVTGPTIIQRNDPGFDINGVPFIDTEIIQLDLQGNSELLGPVQINLNPEIPSTGRITGPGPDMFYPAQSFFNVFIEVTVPQLGGIVLHNEEPLYIETIIDCIPPYGTAYEHMLGAGVPFVDDNGNVMAVMIQAAHKLEKPLFSVLPGGNLDLAGLGPFEFAGRSFFGGGVVEPMPPPLGWPPTGRLEPPLLGLVSGTPNVNDNLDGLSFGQDEITLDSQKLEILSFSVDNGSVGGGSAVNFEFATGTDYGPPDVAAPPEQIADIFFSPLLGQNFLMFDEKDPTCSVYNMTVTNSIMTASNCQKPNNPPGWPGGQNPENTDALEISNVFKVGNDTDFDNKIDMLTGEVFFSIDLPSVSVGMAVPDFRPPPVDGVASPEDILMAPPPGGSFGVFASGILDMGLQIGDELDAFCLTDDGQFGFLNPGTDEALFSLGPGSPSLGGNSPADVFYTNFNGTFMLYKPAPNLGLSSGDNLDALDCQILLDTLLWTDIEEPGEHGSNGINLFQNHPNPFHSFTTISFEIPSQSFVSMKIYNIVGEEVTTLINERMLAGIHEVSWNPGSIANGIYFCNLSVAGFNETIKLVLME